MNQVLKVGLEGLRCPACRNFLLTVPIKATDFPQRALRCGTPECQFYRHYFEQPQVELKLLDWPVSGVEL